MLSANERRQEILETISAKREVIIPDLASRFHVNERTIQRDIELLSCEYPIYTVQGNGGGVKAIGTWYFSRVYLKDRQEKLLLRLLNELSSDDRAVMQSILDSFAKPKL